MNRKERRAQVKNLQKTGKLTREEAREIVERRFQHYPLEEGTKVKLNWELIKRHPDWKIQREDYRAWVEEHKDDIFTVEWDELRKKNNSSDKKILVCLKEDTTEPKWLFYTSTLVPLPIATITLEDGTKQETVVTGEIKFDKIQEAVNEALNREKEEINKSTV